MAVNRKQFLGLVATGVAGVAGWKPSRLWAETPQTDQVGYSPAMFQKYVGTTFRVTGPGAPKAAIDMVLQSVTQRSADAATVQFSLEFLAPAGEPIGARSYTFDHPDLGSIPLFVTLTRRDGEGRSFYRADFNILQNTRSTPIVPPRYRR